MGNINLTEIKHMITNPFSEIIIAKCKDLEIGNVSKYNKDRSMYEYNSLALIKIQNADLLITYKGDRFYFEQLFYAINEVYDFLVRKEYTKKCFAYYLDNETFALAPKESVDVKEFLSITQKLNKHFQFIKPESNAVPLLLRFSVVVNQENPLVAALLQMENSENIQGTYLFDDKSILNQQDKSQEMQVIDVLSWAIENDGVIPYYQGLYDNNKKSIEKYEALMRIKDRDGTIYPPSYFMEVSKKYHLYTTLSSAMLQKVIDDVDKYYLVASVNISAHDINSKFFRENIYSILSARKTKHMFILELLEDEAFRDMAILKDFIKNISDFNVKIAIDDFGSGFSNLFQIGEVNPSFIKIDGNIIKNIAGSNINRSIIMAVKMLADQLGAQIVAEYVENIEIQKCILDLGVDYSQGYYFAEPVPIEDIVF